MQLLLAMLILGLLWLGIKKMATANPANMKSNLRKVAGVASIGLSIILTLRGGLAIAIPLFFAGLGLLGLGHLAGIDLPWAKKTPGQNSHVRTSMLLMQLDHDSGQIEGEVLAGEFAGQALRDLSLEQLQMVFEECITAGDQSPQLLQAYLDTKHPDWHQNFEGAAHNNAGPNASSSAGQSMSEQEALAILGLEAGASKRKIISAHRGLMKKYHPDQGGSDYLATKINQAKDVLIG